MTDTETRPKRVRPPRPRPAQREVIDVVDLARHPNGTIDALAEMQKQIDELRAGRLNTVPSQAVNQIGQGRVADDAELTPWQVQLRAETKVKDPATMKHDEPDRNVPPRLYMKPDGSIVSLQGDKNNRAYYTDVKGFRLLDADEARHYLTHERPKIVALQNKRAHAINALRRAVSLDPILASGLDPTWERDLDKMTLGELEGQMAEIMGTPLADGRPRRVLQRLPRLIDQDARVADAEAKQLLAGVENSPSRSAQAYLEQQARGEPGPRIPVAGRRGEFEVTASNSAQFV